MNNSKARIALALKKETYQAISERSVPKRCRKKNR